MSSSGRQKARPNASLSSSGLTTQCDDVIRVVTGNGGGLGDPKERDPELVRRDIKNGLITPERAREIYGVE